MNKKINKGELIIPTIIFIFIVVYAIDVWDISMPELNLLLPIPLLIAIFILNFCLVVQIILGKYAQKDESFNLINRKIVFILIIFVYAILFRITGFLSATFTYIIFSLDFFNVKKILIIPIAIIGSAIIYIIFKILLRVPM